jgi:hypothetical protein
VGSDQHDQQHVPEKQMIFLLVFNLSLFCVCIMLVFGTARSLIAGTAGGVIAAGILKYILFCLVAIKRFGMEKVGSGYCKVELSSSLMDFLVFGEVWS